MRLTSTGLTPPVPDINLTCRCSVGQGSPSHVYARLPHVRVGGAALRQRFTQPAEKTLQADHERLHMWVVAEIAEEFLRQLPMRVEAGRYRLHAGRPRSRTETANS